MSARLGLQLGARSIRAVRLDAWPKLRCRAVEVEWDAEDPAHAIAAIRGQLGPARRVAAAVDLTFLYVKNLPLPPVAASEKRRMLSLDPERFFPVRCEDLVFCVRETDSLVFAARELLITAWTAALESLGPIERIEPAPIACARALVASGVRDALLLRNGRHEGVEILEVRGGQCAQVRRLYGDLGEALAALPRGEDQSAPIFVTPWDEEQARADLRPLPMINGLGERYLGAYGAALGLGRGRDELLLPAELERKISRRRRAQLLRAGATFGAALLLGILSLDASRTRTERELEGRIASLRQRTGNVLALQAEAEALAREALAIARIEATRPDHLRALLALSRLLPPDAHIRNLSADGSEWQISGYARDAARLIALLEDAPEFEAVRFLAATSRVRFADETYENFSLAFRYVPAP